AGAPFLDAGRPFGQSAGLERNMLAESGLLSPESFAHFTPRARAALIRAQARARQENRRFIDGDHLLMSLTMDLDCVALRSLIELGVDVSELWVTLSRFTIESGAGL